METQKKASTKKAKVEMAQSSTSSADDKSSKSQRHIYYEQTYLGRNYGCGKEPILSQKKEDNLFKYIVI